MILITFHLFYLNKSITNIQINIRFLPKLSYNHYLCLKIKINLKDIAKLKNYLIVHMYLVKNDYQWRHMMLCLKVANNETNNYRTCQSLFNFIKLTISSIDKEPIRKLNKSSNVINKSQILKNEVNCSNWVKLLNVCDASHGANSKDYPFNNDNQINKHWNQQQSQLSNEFRNINDNEYLNLVQ